jgi:serine/threonine-protein kinase
MALLESGKAGEAAKSLERALVLDPRSSTAMMWLGRVHQAEGRRAEAEAAMRKAGEMNPGDWRPPSELGSMLFRQARYAEAVELWQKAAEKTPDNARLLRNLAAGYHMLDRFDEAASTLQKALEYEPNAQVWANLGTARFFQGQYLSAVTAMEKAVELNPNSFLYWGNLGDAYRWAPGKKERAPETYRRALQLVETAIQRNPKDLEAKGSRAVYLAKSGEAAAARTLVASITQAPDLNPGVRFKCALASEIAGDRERALALLESAMKGGYSLREVTREPDLVNLRADARYHRFAARLTPKAQ